VKTYEAGEVLFSEADQPDYVFLVIEGTVKLSINSTGGRRLILGMVTNGEFVGVASLLCNKPQETTAEAVYTSKIAVVAANEFRNFLLRHPDAYALVSEELGREFNKACEQLRTVVLSSSAPQKLARLLLDWSKSGQVTDMGARFRFCMTHEELGECIGASRETVSRVMTTFKGKKLVMLNGSTLTIPNPRAWSRTPSTRDSELPVALTVGLLRLPLLSDVANEGKCDVPALMVEGLQHDVDGELGAVSSQREQIEIGAHLPGAGMGLEILTVPRMSGPEPLRDEELDGLAAELGGGVAKELGGARIRPANHPLWICGEDGVGGDFEEIFPGWLRDLGPW